MCKRLSIWLLAIVSATAMVADDFIDDLYYTPRISMEQQIEAGNYTPLYDKNVQELQFYTDSTFISDIPSTQDTTIVK